MDYDTLYAIEMRTDTIGSNEPVLEKIEENRQIEISKNIGTSFREIKTDASD